LWSAGKITGIIRSLIYFFVAGLVLALPATFLPSLLLYQRIILGSLIIAYGAFRLYKTLESEKKSEEEDDEE
jgi:hypothetical protein